MSSNNTALQPSKWVDLYGDYLFSYARLKVSHKENAEDLVQETFISAIKAKDTFKGDSSEKTWLMAILKNKIIDHYRKKDVLRNTTEYLTETEETFEKHFFEKTYGHWLADAAPKLWKQSADAPMNQAEFDTVLHQCIQKMPAKLVPVFIARFLDDEDSEIICKVHNLTASNYWVMVHRAKLLIRSCLEKNWFYTNPS